MSCPTLTYDHVLTNPIIISERHSQHSHLTMWEHIPQPCEKGPALTYDNQCQKGRALTFDHARNQSYVHVERALHLHSTMRRTNPMYMSKGLCTYIRPCKEPILCACRKGFVLTSDHVGTNPTVTSKWPLVPD